MKSNRGSDFRCVGAERFRSVLDSAQCDLIAALCEGAISPGKRLSAAALEPVADLVTACGPIGGIAFDLMGSPAKAVRALLLDKTDAANWRLGWHQDRTIAVKERREWPGFDAWSVKGGQLHVQPPHKITASMVTLRVHLDPVDLQNAPLEILPGSHLLGRLTNEQVEHLAIAQQSLICLAEAGDVWAYSTPIVHASLEQRKRGRRRVLQLDYSADELPGGLEWACLT